MNAAPDAPWSRWRLWWVAVVVGLAQVLAVFVLSERAPGPAGSRHNPRMIRNVAGTPAERALAESWAWSDPTIFALVHPRGFSGSAWGRSPLPAYEVPRWADPPSWLRPEPGRLGAEFSHLVREEPRAKQTPEFPAPFVIPAVAPERGRTQTLVKVDGDLPPLLSTSTLPPWPNPEILTSTVVRVLVSRAGEVFSAVLAAGSGSRAADERALEFAQAARFGRGARTLLAAPASAADFRTGRLVFEWLTVEPGGTNSPAAKPSP